MQGSVPRRPFWGHRPAGSQGAALEHLGRSRPSEGAVSAAAGRERAWCWGAGQQAPGWSREGKGGQGAPGGGQGPALLTGKRVSHGGLGSRPVVPSLPQEQGSNIPLDPQPPGMPTASSSRLPCSWVGPVAASRASIRKRESNVQLPESTLQWRKALFFVPCPAGCNLGHAAGAPAATLYHEALALGNGSFAQWRPCPGGPVCQ